MTKKVLFLMHGLYTGGAEKILRNTLKVISKDKYEITLILIKGSEANVKDIPSNVQCIVLTHDDKPNEYRLFARLSKFHVFYNLLYRLYIKKKYDVEIAFLEGMATHFIASSRNKKSKKIAFIHTDMYENRWSDKDYKSEKQQVKLYHRFNKVVCVSDYCKNQFMKRFGCNYPLITLNNVILREEIIKKSKETPLDIPQKVKITLISVGRAVPQKGYDRLLRVHKKLIEEGFDYNLWLIGNNVKEEFQYYVDVNHLNNSVKLLGLKSNPYCYMKEADLFVCSSRNEGYSTVVCEALILGIPVISTKVSGAEEILDNGNYGLIVDNNEDSLYKGLRYLLSNKNVLEKYKKLAILRSSMFSEKKTIKRLEELIDA